MKNMKLWFQEEEKRNILCVILSGMALILSLGGWLRTALPFDIAWTAILLCGVPIVTGAVRALIKERDIKADVLVSIALVASVYIGEYFAAGEVAFIMAIGTLLEDGTARMTRKGIEKLVRLTPQTARVKRNKADKILPVQEVVSGDLLTVFAGESVPVDGVILSGQTSIDQSVMTGESLPIDKGPGDEVVSGTVNQFGTFEMRATRVGKDSSLQRMIRLAEEADAKKAHIVSLADKWATWAVWVALSCALLTGLLTGELIRAVTVLVVFCPCAFILATPTAVMAGIGNASRFGILIRSGDGLERFANVKILAFDKTGTLTEGKPEVVGAESFDSKISSSELLRLTASAEQRSEHPLGKAMLQSFLSQGGEPAALSDFSTLPGEGVMATVAGKRIAAGKQSLLSRIGISLTPNAEKAAKKYLDKGATVIWIGVDDGLAGLLALADTLRPGAREMVAAARHMGVESMLLTGDNHTVAQEIAAKAGISQVNSELMPEDKMERIRECDKRKENVCMVGDGINDALALRTAYAGIAMGGVGSDIAVEASDAVLVSGELSRIPYLLHISRRTMQKVKHNIMFSLVWNLIAVILSAMGILNPVLGALVHNFGSVAVVINSALLLLEKDRHPQFVII